MLLQLKKSRDFHRSCSNMVGVIFGCVQVLQSAVTLACFPTSKMAAENVDVFASAWSSQINDLSVLVKDINDACHGRSDRQVYLSLPRPGVSSIITVFVASYIAIGKRSSCNSVNFMLFCVL